MAGNIYAWSTTAASNASADSTINWAEGQLPSTVNDSARAEMAVHAAFLADNNASGTTSGSSSAYTLTSNLTSTLVTGLLLQPLVHTANSGACTLNVTPSGGVAFGAKAIKVINVGGEADPAAGMLQANGIHKFNYNSAANGGSGAFILLNPAQPDVSRISSFQYGLTVAASSSALTISLTTAAGSTPSPADPVFIQFRSATGTTGTVSPLAVTAATSLTISAGSTLGVTSSEAFRVWIVGFNDGGTFRLGAVNCSTWSTTAATIYGVLNSAAGTFGGFGSSTAEGGAGAADSAGVIYTGSAVTTKPMRVLGYAEWSASGLTAGTWTTTNLNTLQPYTPETKLPGEIIQVSSSASTTTASTSSTTYTSSGYTVAITPQSATSIIRVQAMGTVQNSANNGGLTRLSRGTTANTNMFGNETDIAGAISVIAPFSNFGLDKPNSSSAQTYALQFKSSAAGQTSVGNSLALQMEAQELMG